MIAVTGAAGFIGSALISCLNKNGSRDIIAVDKFNRIDKNQNLFGKDIAKLIPRMQFHAWLEEHHENVDWIYHIGARTDTTEKDQRVFDKLNLNYSIKIWDACTKFGIPLVYASSAATYGMGELGFRDDHDLAASLKPMNPYGKSKNDFDRWVLAQETEPPFWAGLKFFNVYGPNEYHKGRMASVIYHTVKQIRETGKMRLFRSHRPGFADGQQKRDFVFVKDVLDICLFLKNNTPANGLYNVGCGKARTFLDLAENTFRALDLDPDISFIDTPADIRDTYQYFTEAPMTKLRGAGYQQPFTSLEDGIDDYVRNYLQEERYF